MFKKLLYRKLKRPIETEPEKAQSISIHRWAERIFFGSVPSKNVYLYNVIKLGDQQNLKD